MSYSYTLEELEIAVNKSFSWAETLRNLGLVLSGGAVKTLQKRVKENGYNTDHFLGLRWASGRIRPELSNPKPLEEILVQGSHQQANRIKQRLFKAGLKKEQCEWCRRKTWRGKKVSLELDHINGINTDNRLENLRILCPNCHAQTDTYRGKNINKSKYPKEDRLIHKCNSCGNKVSRKGVSCRDCYKKRIRGSMQMEKAA